MLLFAATGTCGPQQPNVVFNGDNLSVTANSNLGECCTSCQNNPLCTAYTFQATVFDNVCYLKSTPAAYQTNSAYEQGISAVVTRPSTGKKMTQSFQLHRYIFAMKEI